MKKVTNFRALVKNQIQKKNEKELIKQIGILFKENKMKNHTLFLEDLKSQIYEIDDVLNIVSMLICNGYYNQIYNLKFLKPLKKLLTELKKSEATCLN